MNHVVPHEELLPTCRQLAADIVSNDQAGVRRILQTYDEGWQMTGADAWDLESRVSADWLRGGGAMSDRDRGPPQGRHGARPSPDQLTRRQF